MQHWRLFLFLLQQFCCTSSFTQQPGNKLLQQYTTADGLAGNDVMKTIADRNGFLWVATHSGISRFDGREFKNYYHIPGDSTSLRSIWITDLLLDKQKKVWATTEWGICYYDEALDRFRYINHKDSITILYKAPLTCDRKGNVWLAAENGLYKIDPDKKRVIATSLKRVVDPQCISEDAAGNILIGTRGDGIYSYSPFDDKTERLICPGASPKAHYMSCLTYNNSTWMATSDGLVEITDKHYMQLYANGSPDLSKDESRQLISFIYQPANDRPAFLCCTYDKRMVSFDITKKLFTHQANDLPYTKTGLPPTVVYNISQYRQHTWFSTQLGLYKVTAAQEKFYPASKQLTTASGQVLTVQHIIPDKKDSSRYLIFSQQDNGTLLLFNQRLQKIEKIITGKSALTDESTGLSALLQDSSGRIYTFIGRYITFFSAEGKWQKEVNTGRIISSACFDEKGNIWMGTTDGVSFFNMADHTVKIFDCNFSGTDVERTSAWYTFGTVAVANQNEQTLWLTSVKYGLFSFDKQTKKFTPHRQPFTGLYETLNRCTDLLINNDTVWVSNTAGLTAYLPQQKLFFNYNISHGLKSTYVYSICRTADGLIWGRGNMGLFSFEATKSSFQNYGLPASLNEFYFRQKVFADDDNCLLGVPGGYGVFKAREKQNKNLPVYLNRLVIGNSDAGFQKEENKTAFASLSYNQNDLRIDFSTPDFSDEPVYYSYLLEGIDIKWADAGEKHLVNYSNIKPGTYTFKVKTRKGEDEWGSPQDVLLIKIKAAIWQKAWFRWIVALLIVAALLIYYRWRIHQLKKRQLEKTALQQLQLEQYQQELETEQITSFFSSSLVGKDNINDVLTDVAKNLIGKMGFEDCMIYLWNADKTKLIQHAGHGVKGAIENTADKEIYHIPAGMGIIGAAVESRQPLVINDTTSDHRYISVDGFIRQSELCVPVKNDAEIIGAINIEHSAKNYFTKHHVQAVSTIAALMANKIKAIESSTALYQKQLELSHKNRQLAESELAMLRSQMNPHFIFNSLNSVQKYIWENKEEDAAEYLAKFAKLMRAILENSRKDLVSLKEEMEVIKIYTELEHRRSNGRFDYMIKISEDIDTAQTAIPPMLMQPFIENAIWHGLNKKESKGNLLIAVSKATTQLICIVDDDGVGRQFEVEKIDGKKSLGIEITKQRIERIMQDAGNKATVQIEDKILNDKPAGTKVIITLPLQSI